MSLNVPWYIGFLLKILRNYLTSAICKNGMSLVVFCGGSSHGQHSYPSSFFPSSNGKSRGVLHPRVQQVGPEHFGIICFDCHKVSSKFLLADFYGRLLIPPTVVAHTRPALDSAIAQIRIRATRGSRSPTPLPHRLSDGGRL